MTSNEKNKHAYEAARRMRGILYNYPKSQSVRLTRQEAEAIIAVILKEQR